MADYHSWVSTSLCASHAWTRFLETFVVISYYSSDPSGRVQHCWWWGVPVRYFSIVASARQNPLVIHRFALHPAPASGSLSACTALEMHVCRCSMNACRYLRAKKTVSPCSLPADGNPHRHAWTSCRSCTSCMRFGNACNHRDSGTFRGNGKYYACRNVANLPRTTRGSSMRLLPEALVAPLDARLAWLKRL